MFSRFEHLLEARHKALCCLVGLAIALLTGLIALQIILHSAKEQMRAQTSLFQSNVQTVNTARESLFEFVKTIETDPCSPETLSLLSHQLYLHYIVIDIVAFREDANEIVCTALSGVLETPVGVKGPTRHNPLKPDRQSWNAPELPFLPYEGGDHLVREGRYGLIIDTKILKEAFAGRNWQVFVRTPDNAFSHHAFGNPTLYSDQKASLSSLWPHNLVAVEACVTPGHYLCMLLARPLTQVLRDNGLVLLPGGFLAVLLGLLSYQFAGHLIARRRSTQGRIAHALNAPGAHPFYCHYQPIIDCTSGEIVGCEVLARYRDDLGTVSPFHFIPIVEDAGQTWFFTEMIMEKVVGDFSLLPELPDDFRISINIFPDDLAHKNLMQVRKSNALGNLLALGPKIVLEILETRTAQFSTTVLAVQHLKLCGAEIAIDDFGTGFSNLEQLKSVDADYLKIDKTFVDEIVLGNGSVAGSFVKHIVSLASDTRIKVVAEGIEHESQVEALLKLGVIYGQGYYYSRPVSIAGLASLLAEKPFLRSPQKPSEHARRARA